MKHFGFPGFRRLVPCLLTLVSAVGCGSHVPVGSGSDEPSIVPLEQLRSQFEIIAEDGYVGSGLSGLKPTVEGLQKDTLKREFAKLEAADAAGDQYRVREAARKIIRLL